MKESSALPLLLIAIMVTAGSALFGADVPRSTPPPNIIWIIGDDLGVELGCYGNPDVRTPQIDRLAKDGARYANAFATAPVCSSSRSAFITGMYQTRIGSMDHRTMLEQPLPVGVKPITSYLRDAGYLCANIRGLGANAKEDFNFTDPGVFDSKELSDLEKAVAARRPFFAQFNFFEPHRNFSKPEAGAPRADPATVRLPPQYPDHPLARQDWAAYLDAIGVLDRKVGQLLAWLDRQGVTDNTLIFLFGDNGRPHVWDKQWLSDAGLRVPLIVKWPGRVAAGTTEQRLVSLIDVSAQTLVAAGLKLPAGMDGRAFLGADTVPRTYAFGARDRCGEAFDRIRSVHSERFNYVRNYYPELPYWQTSRYKSVQYPVLALLKRLHTDGRLTPPQARYFADRKPLEELYDLKNDPHELRNLATDPAYAAELKQLRQQLDGWIQAADQRAITFGSPEEYRLALESSQRQKGFVPDAWDQRALKVIEELRAREFRPAGK
ncbi:MAG: sulfatase [Opitutaceae bacterium]|nr:sulfatase [Opitutaceae bacterium]